MKIVKFQMRGKRQTSNPKAKLVIILLKPRRVFVSRLYEESISLRIELYNNYYALLWHYTVKSVSVL